MSATAKHTPGPWFYNADVSYIETVALDPTLKRCLIVADPFLDEPMASENQAANARLMAAAPDLLQACRATLLHMYDDQEMSAVETETLYRTLKAAIDKAEGRTA